MSTDKQEKSPTDQRKALTEYAKKHRYQIVGEYIDEGISGDATEKRSGFLRMIADCRLKRFEMVLCWDQDRFGRFDPLEAGYWVKPMRDAGIVLETIAQGRVDWSDFAGRLIWSVNQEAKHAFLRDLARNSLRGNIERAKSGRFVGRAPFGYSVSNGQLSLGSDIDVAAVRRVFELRVKFGLGHRVIGLKMKSEGFTAPSGRKYWSADTVRIILSREIYTGTLIYGRRHKGKYSTMVDGTVAPAKAGVSITNHNPIRIENTHPAIIDRKTWLIVESMRTDPPRPHANIGNSGAPLAGLLRCGRCGGAMYSQSLQRKAGQKSPNYICGSYMLGKGCGYCCIGQDKIHQIVAEKIRSEVLMGSIDDLRFAIETRLKARRSDTSIEASKRQLKKLDQQIEVASSRLLIVNQRLFADLQKRLLDLQDQRAELGLKISNHVDVHHIDVESLVKELWSLGDVFKIGDACLIRTRLKTLVDHIRLDFEIGQKTGRGQGYSFTGCELILRQNSIY